MKHHLKVLKLKFLLAAYIDSYS